MRRTRRTVALVVGVLLLHLLVLRAMQTDVLHRVAQALVPAEIVVEIKAEPRAVHAPESASTSPSGHAPEPSRQAAPQSSPGARDKTQDVQVIQHGELSAATQQSPPSSPTTAPSTTTIGPGTAASTPATAPHASATAPGATLSVELPSKDAAYLNNPKPPYPKRSWQLHEQGKVVVRVWIGTDGQASQASVTSSSGFERLDLAAVNAALAWRYVPGKRAGVAEAMWFDIPVDWVLQ